MYAFHRSVRRMLQRLHARWSLGTLRTTGRGTASGGNGVPPEAAHHGPTLQKGVLFLLLLAAMPAYSEQYPLEVFLPEPGYRRSDGSLVSFTEFKKTTVMYGTCSRETEIDRLLGQEDVRSWGFKTAVFYVPVNTDICVVAVVVGLDDQPMARSSTVKFYTGVVSDKPRPRSPFSLRVEPK